MVAVARRCTTPLRTDRPPLERFIEVVAGPRDEEARAGDHPRRAPSPRAHETRGKLMLALVGGVPLHVVAARLGDDPKTVLSVYAHLLPTADTAAAQVVASALIDKPLTEPSPSPL